MLKNKSIICNNCQTVVIKDEKELQDMILTEDVKCPKCKEIVVSVVKFDADKEPIIPCLQHQCDVEKCTMDGCPAKKKD